MLLLNCVLVIWFAGSWTRKQPSLGGRYPVLSVLQKNLDKSRIKRDTIFRVLGLHVVHPAVHHTALHKQAHAGEIKVRPLKGHDFTGSQAEATRDPDLGLKRLNDQRC